MKPGKNSLWIGFFWLLAIFLLWYSLRDVHLTGILELIRKLDGWQISLLISINALIIILITSRWNFFLKALCQFVPFLRLVGYRLAGFAVSYFTPGPQFGGEPLQVLLLRRGQVNASAALTSVYLDKVMEVLSNFTFLIFGVLVLFQHGLISNASLGFALVLPLVLLFPSIHLFTLWKGYKPLSHFMGGLNQRYPKSLPLIRLNATIVQMEEEINVFAREKPAVILVTVCISAVNLLLMAIEFGLVYHFLGETLTAVEIIIVFVMARLAFLVPVPAGIGALEGSQVLAASFLGFNPAAGLAACVWIRARDLTLGLVGLWLGLNQAGLLLVSGRHTGK